MPASRWGIPVLALVASTVSAQRPLPSGPDIVVTGKPLSATKAALDACVARHCPLPEDVAASLAHAENLFVAGDYKSARQTLNDAIARDKGGAKRFPVEVAGLYRANGRIAAHLGEAESYRVNTIAAVDALRAGLSDSDPRIFAQRVEIADMFGRLDRPEAALTMYRDVAHDAQRLRLPQIEGPARLRIAMLLARHTPDKSTMSSDARRAFAAFDEVADDTRPEMRNYAFVARVLKAQLMARKGNSEALDAIIAELQTKGGAATPILIDSKPPQIGDRKESILDVDALQTATARMPVGSFEKQWIDVSFWIKPDGHVADAEVVRESETPPKWWIKPVLESVRSRRYAPLKLAADDPGLLRIERMTYTSNFDASVSGTRLRTRGDQPVIERLDLTSDPSIARSGSPGGPGA